MANVVFDGSAQRIIVAYGPGEASAIVDVKDVYSRWKDWIATGDNAKYLQAMSSIGGESLGGGEFAGATFFLLNGWTVAPQPTQSVSSLNLVGNLFPFPDSNPTLDYGLVTGGRQVSVERRTSTLSVGVSSDGNAAEIAAAVWSRLIEAGYTAQDVFRLMSSVLFGRTTVAGTNVQFKDIAGSKTRVQATMDYTNHERDAVTLDPT